jgi:glycosyltransferase involved in cell wall biosynthesis
VDQFTARIRWLASHPGERRAMGSAARAFAERHLDAAEMCGEYESLLDELLGADQRAATRDAPTIRSPAA